MDTLHPVLLNHPLPFCTLSVELQDFRLTQERAVASDARASLDAERAHVADVASRLTREKTTNNDLQAALDAARDQITRLKVALEKAQAEGETLR